MVSAVSTWSNQPCIYETSREPYYEDIDKIGDSVLDFQNIIPVFGNIGSSARETTIAACLHHDGEALELAANVR